MKDITNRNYKGKLHGYQERYLGNGNLGGKYFYNNGKLVDYGEFYYRISCKLTKSFYI